MNNEEEGSIRQSDKKDEGNVWLGIGIGFLIYLIPSLFTIFGLFPVAFIAPIIHVAAIIYFFSKNKKMTGIGLLIFAGIVILLITACFGFVIFSLNNYQG
ncbi:hypothetical protein MXL46_13110 [Heyndrickxia sporothermodurans]|uniref:Uncharacterized protein n=1 Tax=Heyndrickxia sporothermodurans TaxID=46224 RepID=A0A150KMA2_9BACI|nr:hypothetical protein [Heyndrickxia sporothermodurans]KYC92262.1 hypothetical protein B4102_3746 [Heyndrickxia sporothermodurans]MBL5783134.1 hypothetical protein [Heyndrickxia sporothermodurans]MBL5791657.1 hypothetical protein [Heyndrickxia sporothermodurans]MBL5803046.1 hypothetical protein [Heyndrickxia sporothermodurans]MBL5852748.1 hypothetical protein [Heyndrickxia sporothermodurans]